MKKKILLLLLLLLSILLLSGCTVNYDLKITEDDFQEQSVISVDTNKNEIYQDQTLPTVLDNLKPMAVYANSNSTSAKRYNLTRTENNNIKNLNIANTFSLSDFYRSAAVNQCFKELNIQTEDNYVLIRTNRKCEAFDNYPLLENITINIETDMEVIVSNADKVDGNVYTWNITRENYMDKAVRLSYSLPRVTTENKDDHIFEEKPESTTTREDAKKRQYNVIFLISLVFLGLIIGLAIKAKNHR